MNLKITKLKIWITISLVLVLVLPSLLLSAGLSIPFGGKIATVIPCYFSGGNFLITQVPVAGPPLLILRPGISRLYAYYQPTPGSTILGTAFGMDTCIIFPFPPVVVSAPLITMIGTSGVGGVVNNFTGGSGSSGPGDDADQNTPPSDQQQQPNQDNKPCSSGNSQSSAYTLANEGWRNGMYLDSEGNRTIGVGHLVENGENIPSNISDAEVQRLYEQDLAEARAGAMASASRHGVDWNSLSSTRQTVLVDMAFNMGASGGQGLDGFNNMWSAIRNQDWATAGKEVYGSGYTGSRADRNSRAMSSNDDSEINNRIDDDPRASNLCSGQSAT